jgi:hypothetical protein
MDSKDQKLIAEAYNRVLEAAVSPLNFSKEYYCYSITLTKDKDVFDINDSWIITANNLEEAQEKVYEEVMMYSVAPPEYFDKLPIKDNKIAIVTTAGFRKLGSLEGHEGATVVTTEHVEIQEMRKLIDRYFRMDNYNVDKDVKDAWQRAVSKL